MKLPDSYSRLEVFCFGFANCFAAFELLADYIGNRVIPTADECKGIRTPLVFIVLFALIINSILYVALFFQIVQEKCTVSRAWFMLGFSGGVVWAFRVYDMFCGFSCCPAFTPCNSFGIGLIIYQCYVYYVVVTFIMSLSRVPSPNSREDQTVGGNIDNAGRVKINLPASSFGFYSRQAGAWIFALINHFSAYKVLADYILKRMIRTPDCADESSATEMTSMVIVPLGLIFNYILQIVLILGVTLEQSSVCRIWLALDIFGGIVWTFNVYVLSCATCGEGPTSTTCTTLAIVAIIYQCFGYYVVFTFTLSLDRQNGMVPGDTNAGPADKQTQIVEAGNLNLTPDGTKNAADLQSPDPGALNSQMGNKSQRQDGIPSFII